MPLDESGSKESVSKNIAAEMRAGKPQRQAVAIALDVQRRARRKKDKKMDKKAFASGFTNACIENGVDPDALIKDAQMRPALNAIMGFLNKAKRGVKAVGRGAADSTAELFGEVGDKLARRSATTAVPLDPTFMPGGRAQKAYLAARTYTPAAAGTAASVLAANALTRNMQRKQAQAAEDAEKRPDYAKRRARIVKALGALFGTVQGATIGAAANRKSPGIGALVGGALGAGAGYGLGAGAVAVRRYAGMDPLAVPTAEVKQASAFEAGFVNACIENGVDPDALIKDAAAGDVGGAVGGTAGGALGAGLGIAYGQSGLAPYTLGIEGAATGAKLGAKFGGMTVPELINYIRSGKYKQTSPISGVRRNISKGIGGIMGAGAGGDLWYRVGKDPTLASIVYGAKGVGIGSRLGSAKGRAFVEGILEEMRKSAQSRDLSPAELAAGAAGATVGGAGGATVGGVLGAAKGALIGGTAGGALGGWSMGRIPRAVARNNAVNRVIKAHGLSDMLRAGASPETIDAWVKSIRKGVKLPGKYKLLAGLLGTTGVAVGGALGGGIGAATGGIHGAASGLNAGVRGGASTGAGLVRGR